jgi:mannosyltransferase OCH1-like enzyme
MLKFHENIKKKRENIEMFNSEYVSLKPKTYTYTQAEPPRPRPPAKQYPIVNIAMSSSLPRPPPPPLPRDTNPPIDSHQFRMKLNKTSEQTKIPKIYKFKRHYDSVIPLHIYQTWFSKNLPPHIHQCIEELKIKNPEFQFHLYDDSDCETFIGSHFGSDVLKAFQNLIPGAYKADLWRYCILYIHGGIYLDVKYHCIQGFRFIALTEKEYFVSDMESSGGGIYNALMVCKPANPYLWTAIRKIVENTQCEFYGYSSLEPTGPLLLKSIFGEDILTTLQHIERDKKTYVIHDDIQDIDILKMNEHYRQEQRENTNNKSHYSSMWAKREVYGSAITEETHIKN